MKLNQIALNDRAAWSNAGFTLPTFDRAKMIAQTQKTPKWVHFGGGNIFRAFPAALQQKLLNNSLADTGIIMAEGFDYDIVDKAYRPFDDLSVLVTLKCDGTIEKNVIASVAASAKADVADAKEWATLCGIFRNPSLQMVSFTITEKGYSLKNAAGEFTPLALNDMANGPEKPMGIMAKVAALCYQRYLAGKAPLALVSMDNCSHNGEKLSAGVMEIVRAWQKNGQVEADFAAYMSDPKCVSFPWSMIDKITPRPDDCVKKMLEDAGFEDSDIIVTDKKSYTAAFVNAEEAQYLVIEDAFPNGRPALEQAGVIFTTRDTVNMVEKMKVCTCLNPLHTALAIYGCLLGYTKIFEEVRNPALKKMIEKIGYVEGMPVVVDPKIIAPTDFIREVLEVRLPNPFMPDAPQRIATDTSQKLSVRFGETVKAYQKSETLDVSTLECIPLVFAGWCRYLMGIDDAGNAFEISPDPLLAEVTPFVKDIKLGDKGPFDEILRPILTRTQIFGFDLYEAGMAEKVVNYFAELVAGKGAVAATLEKYFLA